MSTKSKLPPPYTALEGISAYLQKSDITSAQRALKRLMEELANERADKNTALLKKLDKFAARILSPRGKKTPEEVAILPAVVKILLKR